MLNIQSHFYIGLMSGTSADGVDGVLVAFSPNSASPTSRPSANLISHAHIPFDATLRNEILAMQMSGADEIKREALLANRLAQVYAQCIQQVMREHPKLTVQAVGVHGQTIRHRPEWGFTRQVNNPALLAELTGLSIVADFRSRDVAAGGQGAPLVPAFHRAFFALPQETSVVVNIGGMSNITILHANGDTLGFDTGPGNVLLDAWIHQHHAQTYDKNGAWAAQGKVHQGLLDLFLDENFFRLTPPKSTGRDLFDVQWLQQKMQQLENHQQVLHLPNEDVQMTLTALTAKSIAQDILRHASTAKQVFICGGGAYNQTLMQVLQDELPNQKIQSTLALGVAPEHVESMAFAWLAQQFCLGASGNLPAVTGAKGSRILGCWYPA